MGAKLKTSKAAAKRIKITARGMKRRKSGLNHRITGKGKTTRDNKSGIMLSPTQVKRMKLLMPGT